LSASLFLLGAHAGGGPLPYKLASVHRETTDVTAEPYKHYRTSHVSLVIGPNGGAVADVASLQKVSPHATETTLLKQSAQPGISEPKINGLLMRRDTVTTGALGRESRRDKRSDSLPTLQAAPGESEASDSPRDAEAIPEESEEEIGDIVDNAESPDDGTSDLNVAGALTEVGFSPIAHQAELAKLKLKLKLAKVKLKIAKQAELAKIAEPAKLDKAPTLAKGKGVELAAGSPAYLLVKASHECSSADDDMGDQASLADCGKVVANAGGKLFVYGFGAKSRKCFKERTTSTACTDGWKPDFFNAYIVSQAETVINTTTCASGYGWMHHPTLECYFCEEAKTKSICTIDTGNGQCGQSLCSSSVGWRAPCNGSAFVAADKTGVPARGANSAAYLLVKAGHACKSADVDMGEQASLAECGEVVAKAGGQFFIYGICDKRRQCYQESTTSTACTEGWELDSFNLYEISQVPTRTAARTGAVKKKVTTDVKTTAVKSSGKKQVKATTTTTTAIPTSTTADEVAEEMPVSASTKKKKPQGGSSIGLILGIIAGVVVLGGAPAGGFYVWKQKQKTRAAAAAASEEEEAAAAAAAAAAEEEDAASDTDWDHEADDSGAF